MTQNNGLFIKYHITKANGEPITDFAFVLRIKDPHARRAMYAYTNSVYSENPELANDLKDEVRQFEVEEKLKRQNYVDANEDVLMSALRICEEKGLWCPQQTDWYEVAAKMAGFGYFKRVDLRAEECFPRDGFVLTRLGHIVLKDANEQEHTDG